MNFLVAYDVSTTTENGRRRLRRVARICEGYGQRVQYSVFEMVCSRADYVRLMGELVLVVVPSEDSLRVYRLDSDGFENVVHLGIKRAFDVADPWTI